MAAMIDPGSIAARRRVAEVFTASADAELDRRLHDWADWHRDGAPRIGYPTCSVEGRLIRDRGVLPAGTRGAVPWIEQSPEVAAVDAIIAAWKQAGEGWKRAQARDERERKLYRWRLWEVMRVRYLVRGLCNNAQRARALQALGVRSVSTYEGLLRIARGIMRERLGL